MAAITQASDSSLLVSFKNEISPSVNRQVMALFHAFQAQPLPEVTSVSPAYASVLFRFDPLLMHAGELESFLKDLLLKSQVIVEESRVVDLPVCYGSEFGPDLPELAERAGLREEDIMAIHAGVLYRSYFLGFAPGFAYLGEVDERIAQPRREKARKLVPAGSVGIAGRQTGVYPHATPGGWNIIGRCPISLFNAADDPPSYIRPGDEVRFQPITIREFEAISSRSGSSR